MYFAHAGHHHLTEQATRSHEISSLLLAGGIVGVITVVAILYALFAKKQTKKVTAISSRSVLRDSNTFEVSLTGSCHAAP